MERKKVSVEGDKLTCEEHFDSVGDRYWVEFNYDNGYSRLSIGTKKGLESPDEIYLNIGGVIILYHRKGRWFSKNRIDLHPWWRKRA